MTQADYAAAWAPGAQAASANTGWPASVILAQMLTETGAGTPLENTQLMTQCHNYAGIKFTGIGEQADAGGFACYPSDAAFWSDYERVQRLSFYNSVRTPNAAAAVAALAASPYAASHYGGGSGLLQLVQNLNLTQYDQQLPSATANGMTAAMGPGGVMTITGLPAAPQLAGCLPTVLLLVCTVLGSAGGVLHHAAG